MNATEIKGYNDRYANYVRFAACCGPITEAVLIQAHDVAAGKGESCVACGTLEGPFTDGGFCLLPTCC